MQEYEHLDLMKGVLNALEDLPPETIATLSLTEGSVIILIDTAFMKSGEV